MIFDEDHFWNNDTAKPSSEYMSQFLENQEDDDIYEKSLTRTPVGIPIRVGSSAGSPNSFTSNSSPKSPSRRFRSLYKIYEQCQMMLIELVSFEEAVKEKVW